MTEQGAPDCFSKQWDPKEPECAGGLDPAYTNTDKNSRNYATHQRDRCVWFGACGTRTQALRMEEARNLIPPQSLVRSTTPSTEAEKELAYWKARATNAPATTSSPPVLQPAIREFAYSMATAQQRVEMERYQKEMEEARRRGYPQPPGWGAPPMPWGVQQMMPVNYQMPQYLSAPEDMYEGRGFLEMLATTVFRSVMKSAGHSVAHVFDAIPFGRRPSPWRPPDGGGGGG